MQSLLYNSQQIFFRSFLYLSFSVVNRVPDFYCNICLCRASAEDAIQKMQGKIIGQQIVHISWGRSPIAKQVIFFSSSLSSAYFDPVNNDIVAHVCLVM